jgi:hypothetical protein
MTRRTIPFLLLAFSPLFLSCFLLRLLRSCLEALTNESLLVESNSFWNWGHVPHIYTFT